MSDLNFATTQELIDELHVRHKCCLVLVLADTKVEAEDVENFADPSWSGSLYMALGMAERFCTQVKSGRFDIDE